MRHGFIFFSSHSHLFCSINPENQDLLRSYDFLVGFAIISIRKFTFSIMLVFEVCIYFFLN